MASLPVVSASIIKSGDKIAATFDWLCVPEHMVILNNDMLEDWAPEFAAFTDVVDENVVVSCSCARDGYPSSLYPTCP